MKKLLSMCAVALFALVFVGCNADAIDDGGKTPETPDDKTPKVITIRVSLPDNASRATYTEDSEGIKLKWEEGDKIGVYGDYDDTNPNEFTLKSGAGTNEGVFEGVFSKYEYYEDEGEKYYIYDENRFNMAYPYTPGKSINDFKNELPAKLVACQKGTLADLKDYDPIVGLYDKENGKRTLEHSIAVIKVKTPSPSTNQDKVKVGVRGLWQPGFTYYAKYNGSAETYIAVPASEFKTKDLFVAMYDESQNKCKLYQKSRAEEAGIGKSEMITVDVSSGTAYEYDCDGLIENHEYVKMGDNLGMATMNIGANSPTGYGYYFRFGDREGWAVLSDDFDVTLSSGNCKQCTRLGTMKNNSFVDGDKQTFSKNGWLISNQQMVNFQGNPSIKDPNTYITYGDAATYNWGGGWKMMNSNIEENWTKKEISTEALKGYELTSGSKTVFLPAACHCSGAHRQGEVQLYCGHYWSTLIDNENYEKTSGSLKGYNWFFVIGRTTEPTGFQWIESARYGGFSIRPIIDLK